MPVNKYITSLLLFRASLKGVHVVETFKTVDGRKFVGWALCACVSFWFSVHFLLVDEVPDLDI